LRYFVIHTRCRWISNTLCAPCRYSTASAYHGRRPC
jgi:hypothetical protein